MLVSGGRHEREQAMKVKIFGSWRCASIAMVAVALLASPAAAQRAGTTTRDATGDAAAALLNQGRANEARITLLKAMRASTSPEQQALYRLELGDTFLYEGRYG